MALLSSLYKDAKGDWDELAIGGHCALFGTLGAAAFQLYHGAPVDVQNLGIGLAAILGGMGGSMRARDGATSSIPDSPIIPAEPGSTGSPGT